MTAAATKRAGGGRVNRVVVATWLSVCLWWRVGQRYSYTEDLFLLVASYRLCDSCVFVRVRIYVCVLWYMFVFCRQ